MNLYPFLGCSLLVCDKIYLLTFFFTQTFTLFKAKMCMLAFPEPCILKPLLATVLKLGREKKDSRYIHSSLIKFTNQVNKTKTMQKLVLATQKVEYIVIWGYRMQHYFFFTIYNLFG